MSLTYDFRIFIWILLASTLLTAVYTVVGLLRRGEKRRSILLRCIVMLLCPVVGPLFVFLGWAVRSTVFRKPVNLEDVLFSKDREDILLQAEEDRERNLVPIEDALLINDKDDTRALILDVIKMEPKKSLYSLSLALESEDSELSHYAAAVIQSELGKTCKAIQVHSERAFALEEELSAREEDREPLRTEAGRQLHQMQPVQEAENGNDAEDREARKKFYADISPELEASRDYSLHRTHAARQGVLARDGETVEEKTLLQELTEEMTEAHKLFSEIDDLLRQRLLTEFENSRFTETLSRLGELVEKRDVLSPQEYKTLVLQNLAVGETEKAAHWSERAFLLYPDAVETHAARVKLRFAQSDREGFFAAVDEMKRSGVPLDREMLELVRFYA